MATKEVVAQGASASANVRRHVGAFHSDKARRKFWFILISMSVAALCFALGLLVYDNPMPFGTEGFWLIARRRADALIAMLLVAVCQSIATVAFHTVTNNRILTPSIMGFEALYRAINTTMVFLFGAIGLAHAQGIGMFVFQLLLMVGLSLVLYSWLLTNNSHNMHAMLLVGVVIGGGLGSLATFMQRVLTPSEFDVLAARLFGSVTNADTDYFPIAIPVVATATAALFLNARRLNVLGLGRDAARNLGVNHKFHAIYTLILVSILIATSTALVGPLTFLGFLVATLAYQFAETYDHRYLFPMSIVTAFTVLTGAYFVMRHIFYAQGVVSIIIELVGGSVFLLVILRKGRL